VLEPVPGPERGLVPVPVLVPGLELGQVPGPVLVLGLVLELAPVLGRHSQRSDPR